MAYFPFYIDIKDKKCLVVGGGNIAFQKIKVLLQFEVNITVISTQICEEIQAIVKELEESEELEESKKVILNYKQIEDSDIKDYFFVIAATNDRDLNTHISALCKKENILVNVVDVQEECDFIFPSIIKEGNMTISISSGGQSPALSIRIKEKIKSVIPEYYPRLLDFLGEQRNNIHNKIKMQQTRKKVYNEIIAYVEQNHGNISHEEINQIILKYEKLQEGEM